MSTSTLHSGKIVAWTLVGVGLTLMTVLIASGRLAEETQAGRRSLPEAAQKAGASAVSPGDLTLQQRGRTLPVIAVEEPF